MDREREKEYALQAMKWYGWGSPVGLTIFFVGLAFIGVMIRYIING